MPSLNFVIFNGWQLLWAGVNTGACVDHGNLHTKKDAMNLCLISYLPNNSLGVYITCVFRRNVG